VDIYQVNLTRIATEFVAYVEQMRELDLEVAGEFPRDGRHVACTSRAGNCCPSSSRPRSRTTTRKWMTRAGELIRRLVEYKKFKDAAAQLQICEGNRGEHLRTPPGQAGVHHRCRAIPDGGVGLRPHWGGQP